MTSAPITAATIERDISCFECHYNIRGLSADAVCPECGHPVGNTLLAIVDRDAVVNAKIDSEPQLLRSVRDGCVLIFVGVVLWTSMLCVPDSWYRLRTPERRILLYVACAAWACTCFGFHKIAAKASLPLVRAVDPVMRPSLRVTALALAIVPAAVTISADYRHTLYVQNNLFQTVIVIASLLALSLIGPLFFLRLNRLLRQIEMYRHSGLAAFMACVWTLNVVISFALVIDRHDVFNSLDFLTQMPIPPFSCVIFWQELFQLRYSYWRWPWMILSIIPVTSMWLIAMLCLGSWRRLVALR